MTAIDKAGRWQGMAGFTLVELLIALVIVAITAAVAIPAYTSKVNQGRQQDAQRILMSLAQTEEIYRFENGSYTGTIANLTALGWVNDGTINPATGTQYYPTANLVGNTGTNPPNAPPDNTGALGPWFEWTISGNISNGAKPADTWIITNNINPNNTVKGY
jgi:prepilin-type N-terminal cleavage/methylation domain-containing protein